MMCWVEGTTGQVSGLQGFSSQKPQLDFTKHLNCQSPQEEIQSWQWRPRPTAPLPAGEAESASEACETVCFIWLLATREKRNKGKRRRYGLLAWKA